MLVLQVITNIIIIIYANLILLKVQYSSKNINFIVN
jgi:hypothetical protein